MQRKATVRRNAGFTLVELVVAMAIVGILAAIAIPAYSAYVRQANRSDATRTMLSDAQSLQRCYSQNFTYTPAAPCPTPAGTTPSPGGYYSITITIPTATTYSITAVPVAAPQTADNFCKSFTLLSTGQQSSLDSGGADSTKTCWGTQ